MLLTPAETSLLIRSRGGDHDDSRLAESMAGVCHAETMSKRRRVGHILNPLLILQTFEAQAHLSKAGLRGNASFSLFDIVSLQPGLSLFSISGNYQGLPSGIFNQTIQRSLSWNLGEHPSDSRPPSFDRFQNMQRRQQ